LAFLVDYHLIEPVGRSKWRTDTDPWELLVKGLEERRRRELPDALDTLQACHAAAKQNPKKPNSTRQIEKMLRLVEDLASLDAQMQRIPPKFLGKFVSVTGRAARILDQTFGSARRATNE